MGRTMTDPLFEIENRTILLAGGAGGLGSALAKAFAERGARVGVADIDEKRAANVAAALPGSGHFSCFVDVRREESCTQAVEKAFGSGGRLDVLVNCAGVFHLGPAATIPSVEFEASLATNTTGVFLMSQAAAKAMAPRGGGRIITLASVSSAVANPNYAAYAASKSALVGLTRVMALEFARDNITVNAIGPAMIATPMTEKYLAAETNAAYARGKIPMGRLAKADDLVGVAVLLSSAAGSFITGQIIYVDGGRTLS